MAAFCDSCAYGLDNTATPPPDTCIRAIFQVVKGVQSPIYSTASLLFSTIVAVVEVEVERPKPAIRPASERFGRGRARRRKPAWNASPPGENRVAAARAAAARRGRPPPG